MDTEHALFTHFALNQVFSFQTATEAQPKQVDVQSRANLPAREVEEEIANLLIEFKNQDPSSSPKRKSPSSSPLRFETSSSPTVSPLSTPTQKRRKTSSKVYQSVSSEVSGSDVEEPYSDDGTPSFRHFKKSHGEDSEFEYEDDGYGSADHDEYFEEDDDDWLEGAKSSSIAVHGATSPTTGRLIRKKAPSGSACEKHKRWKKRCPDDCPMRSNKQQRKQKAPIENHFSENILGTTISAFESEFNGMRSRSTRGFKFEDQIYSDYDVSPSAQRRAALSSMACEKHTALHARCPPNCPERRPVEAIGRRKKSSTTTTKGDDSSDKEFTAKAPKPKSTKSKGRTGRKYLPQACDRHKLLHAKCPANCPDRIKRDAEAAKLRLPMEISATA